MVSRLSPPKDLPLSKTTPQSRSLGLSVTETGLWLGIWGIGLCLWDAPSDYPSQYSLLVVLPSLSLLRRDRAAEGLFAERHHFRKLADPGWIYVSLFVPLTTAWMAQADDGLSTIWLPVTPFLSATLSLVSVVLGQHQGRKSLVISQMLLFLLLAATSLVDSVNIFSREVATWLSGALVAYVGALYLLMHHLRRNLSYGEASIISQSLSLLSVNAVHRILKFEVVTVPSFLPLLECSCICLLPVMMISGTWIGHRSSSLSRAIAFSIVLLITLGMVMYPWLWTSWKEAPILWLTKYVFSSGKIRILLGVHWIIFGGFFIFTNPPSLRRAPNRVNGQRKWFHLAVVILFTPAIVMDRDFLSVALAGALALFFLLEGYRSGHIPPWGQALDGYFRGFADVKESLERGSAVLSHIYLLLGVSIPIWLPGSTLAAFSGILTLGVGDSMASVIGKRWGYHTWAGSLKSMEGTVAFVLSILTITFLLTLLDERFIVAGLSQWAKYAVCMCATGMLEAVSLQNDNLVIPIYAWLVLGLCGL